MAKVNTDLVCRFLRSPSGAGALVHFHGHADLRPLCLDPGIPGLDGRRGDQALRDKVLALAREPLAGCKTLRKLGHLPEGTGLFLDEAPARAACIVLTHASLGHWALLPFMHPDTPLLSTPTARANIEARLERLGLRFPRRLWVTARENGGAGFACWHLRFFAVDYPVPTAMSLNILGFGRQRILVPGHWGPRQRWNESLERLEVDSKEKADLIIASTQEQGAWLMEQVRPGLLAVRKHLEAQEFSLATKPLTTEQIEEQKQMRYAALQCGEIINMPFEEQVRRDRLELGCTEDEVRLNFAEAGYLEDEIEKALEACRGKAEAASVQHLARLSRNPRHRRFLLELFAKEGGSLEDYLRRSLDAGDTPEQAREHGLKQGFLEEELDGALRGLASKPGEGWPGKGVNWDDLLRDK